MVYYYLLFDHLKQFWLHGWLRACAFTLKWLSCVFISTFIVVGQGKIIKFSFYDFMSSPPCHHLRCWNWNIYHMKMYKSIKNTSLFFVLWSKLCLQIQSEAKGKCRSFFKGPPFFEIKKKNSDVYRLGPSAGREGGRQSPPDPHPPSTSTFILLIFHSLSS